MSRLLYISQYLIQPLHNCYHNTHSVCLSYMWCCKGEVIGRDDHSLCLLVGCHSLFLEKTEHIEVYWEQKKGILLPKNVLILLLFL